MDVKCYMFLERYHAWLKYYIPRLLVLKSAKCQVFNVKTVGELLTMTSNNGKYRLRFVKGTEHGCHCRGYYFYLTMTRL